MERNSTQNGICLPDTGLQNLQLAESVIESAVNSGVETFFLCPGARNAPFVTLLSQQPHLKIVTGFEERSTAFFALGRAQRDNRPTAIITTSGTAVAELLPAVMEADYTGVPLLIITADRPRHYRGSGAPQACEQVGIFSHYTHFSIDIAAEEKVSISEWNQKGPAHLNICFDEPLLAERYTSTPLTPIEVGTKQESAKLAHTALENFLNSTHHPLVIVNGIIKNDAPFVKDFLLRLNAPVILETTSHLREEQELKPLAIHNSNKALINALKYGYPVDGVLRIGSVPTTRLWRDLEKSTLPVLSISETRFSGLSRGSVECVSLKQLFRTYNPKPKSTQYKQWLQNEKSYHIKLQELFAKHPRSEPALVHQLSKAITPRSHIYLGNSMPIREWDLAAIESNRQHTYSASRGLNGIDGQISTFLGRAESDKENWALLGDLTALYDLTAPWFLNQNRELKVTIAIINNGGGMIFDRLFSEKMFLNQHAVSFKPFADLWGLSYERWEEISTASKTTSNRIVEIIPDNRSTNDFWNELSGL